MYTHTHKNIYIYIYIYICNIILVLSPIPGCLVQIGARDDCCSSLQDITCPQRKVILISTTYV